MKKTPWIWAATLLAASLAAQAQTAPRRTYIVQLADAPAAAYTGQVAGLAATKPAPGRRFDSRAAAVQSYLSYLNTRQSAVLATVPAASVKYRYRTAFNGFAALLTDAEAAALAQSAGVVAVNREQRFRPSTSTTGNFLGLTAPGGLHSQGVKGEDVIIGIVDTGIVPEHTAFSDKVDDNGAPVQSHLPGTLAYNPITNTRSWSGICQTGPGFPASSCNNKLIGARFYRAGFDASGAVAIPAEFSSPRDADSHGSHTASTAGGNAGARGLFANGQPVTVSGMAPRARIAAYKACWDAVDPDQTGCYEADTVASIDQAVADGVDIINYSIGGSRTNYVSAVQVAFLFAADAGVFVAASAGNKGPGNTVAHPSPWLTTVAASTHDRDLVATVTLGDGSSYTGASLQTSGLPDTPVVLAQNAGVLPAAQLTTLQLTALQRCFNAADLANTTLIPGGLAAGPNAALDPNKVAGKIVVCDRGSNDRVNKSAAVRAAGGAGVILVNVTGGATSLDADLHTVPTIHLASSARAPVRTYVANGTGTARFTPRFANPNVVAPVMAGFSSRGPSLASPNILKPDITAPGVSVLAAIAPVGVTPEQIAAGNYPLPVTGPISGTSMSSPHVAGLAALLRSAHRTWSPAAIKSALLTTATTNVKLADGTPDTNRFGYGAGHANPNAAVSPGLVYDAGTADYFAFLCGLGLLNPTGSTCNAVGLLPAWNLNLPTLTSDVVGLQTLRRTVTNVGNATTTYTGSATIPGFQVSVSPATLELAPGASGSYTVTALRTNAPIGTWAFGNVDWTSGGQTVRSPLTLRSLSLAVQNEVVDSRVRANKSLTLLTGFDGTMRATATNMVPAVRTPGTVNFGSTNCTATISVPAGAQALRVSMFDAETTGQGRDDLDLVLYLGDTPVASSGSSSSNEQMTLRNPAAGTYTVCVDGFGTSRPGATSSSYTLSSWVVGNGLGMPNTLRVTAPSQVQTAGTGTAVLMWSVPAGSRYLGAVTYANGSGTAVGSTLVTIDNQSAASLSPPAEGAVDAAKLAMKARR